MFDTVLFVALAIAYAEDFTGLSLHERFGIAFGLALLFHFSLHWEWAVRTTKGLLATSGRRRVMWIVNFALLSDLVLCIGSGILITGWRDSELPLTATCSGTTCTGQLPAADYENLTAARRNDDR